MHATEEHTRRNLGIMELAGRVGFSLFFAWMLSACYWLFSEIPFDIPFGERDFIQLFVFAGMVAGYIALHYAAKGSPVPLFGNACLFAELAMALLLPVAALLGRLGIVLPSAVMCLCGLCAGMACASLTVSWLDVLGSIRVRNYLRFTSASLALGVLLFALLVLLPVGSEPVFSGVYIIASAGLLRFVSSRAEGHADFEPAAPPGEVWRFAREVDPPLFVYGMVYGLTFVYLYHVGADALLAGLLSACAGAGLVFAAVARGKSIGITVIQRVLLCVTFAACILVAVGAVWVKLLGSCIVIAAWAAFLSVNYALLVKRSLENQGEPVHRQVPIRLVSNASGFLLGWGIATLIALALGHEAAAFQAVRLILAFVLVVVIMFFYPDSIRHDSVQAFSHRHKMPQEPEYSESELFEARCRGVAKSHGLSPREYELLGYLAHGRNAAYIQEKLSISSHTVKTHMNNIYKKLEVHSQQSLMDVVEEFPLDQCELPLRSRAARQLAPSEPDPPA